MHGYVVLAWEDRMVVKAVETGVVYPPKELDLTSLKLIGSFWASRGPNRSYPRVKLKKLRKNSKHRSRQISEVIRRR